MWLPAGLNLRCIAQLIRLGGDNRATDWRKVTLMELRDRGLPLRPLILLICIVHQMVPRQIRLHIVRKGWLMVVVVLLAVGKMLV